MKTAKTILCLSLLMALPMTSYAQDEDDAAVDTTLVRRVRKTKKVEPTREIKGRVVSQDKHTPLAGVLVQSVAGEGYSGLTEADGTFTIKVPLYSAAVDVTIPGYNRVRVGLSKSGQLHDIVLQSDAARALYDDDDNIMNNARAKNFNYSNAINISAEIENQLGAEVRTVQRSGVSGIGAYMQIAGVNSLNSNAQPLVVIDGVITDMQYEREMLHSGFYNDILSNINVNDIEQVEVMKNGTALYGSRGSNGVILIKTKRNRSLATRIDAFASVGIELMPTQIDVMNGPQYKGYASSLLQSTGTRLQEFKFLKPEVVNGKSYYWYNKYNNDTRWADDIYRQAVTQNYGLSVQGGGDIANYMLSIGYTRANETLKENNMNRLNIRFNTDIKITDYIGVRFDAAFTNTTRKLLDTGAPADYNNGAVTSTNFLAYAKSPMLSPYSFVPDPTTGVGVVNNAHLDIVDEDYLSEVSSLRNANWQLANPLAIHEYGTAENKNYFDNSYVILSVTPEWNPNKHLRISSLFNYTLVNTNEKYYVPLNGVPSYYVAALENTMKNEIGSLYGKHNSVTSDTRIQWKNSYNGHNIDLLGGFRFMNQTYSSNHQSGYNTGNDKTPYINSASNKVNEGFNEKWATLTWYAQAAYNWKNRYYVQGNLTMDTNSQFGRDAKSGIKIGGVKWGIFPSLQAGWVMSNESWFHNKVVNYLKLTAGIDVSGNDDLTYDASRTYFASHLFLTKVPSYVLENIGNTELQWETTRRLNFGFETKMFNNRLSIAFNYFKSWTDNLLTLRELSFLSGIKQNWSNGGSLENKGVDLTLNAHLVSTNDWNWSVGASLGHYVNKLTALPDDQQYVDNQVLGATIRSQIGSSINSFYGFKTAPTSSGTIVYATAAEAASDGLYKKDASGAITYFGAGDVKYVDQNGDGEIKASSVASEDDRTIIGDATPDIYGNLFTSLSFKRLRLDVGFNYSLGGDVYNYNRQQLESGSRFMNQTTAMLRRWSYEGQVTDIPRAAYGDPMGNSDFSDRWIEDGSYLRLKHITLSYQLPINNTYIQGISVWVRANNVFTITKYLGADPEFSMGNGVLFQGIDRGLLSQGRSFNVGVKINL